MKCSAITKTAMPDAGSVKGAVKNFLKNISPFNNRSDMPKVLFVIKKLLAFLVCYWGGLLLAEGVIIGVHFACGKNVLKGEMFSFTAGALIQYYGYIIPILFTLLFWKLTEKRRISEMGISKSFGGWFIGAGMGILLLVLCLGAVVLTGTVKLNGFFADPDVVTIVLYFFGFIIQSAHEEILCRGLMFHSLKDKVSFPAALIISSAVFAAPHFPTLFECEPEFIVSGILDLFAISAVFTILTYRTGNIWMACGLHSLWNFCLECVFGLNLSGNEAEGKAAALIDMTTVGENLLNGGKYGIESSIITGGVLAVTAILLWFFFLRKRSNG